MWIFCAGITSGKNLPINVSFSTCALPNEICLIKNYCSADFKNARNAQPLSELTADCSELTSAHYCGSLVFYLLHKLLYSICSSAENRRISVCHIKLSQFSISNFIHHASKKWSQDFPKSRWIEFSTLCVTFWLCREQFVGGVIAT